MRRVKCILIGFCTFLLFGLDVNASSLSIWANAFNVKLGNTVTISVKAADLGGEFKVTSSDQSVLAGGTNSVWLENDTYTFDFVAKKLGSATITVSAIDAATTGAEAFSGSKSVTLNVVSSYSGNWSGGTTAEKKEYSSNNDLSSLSIDGYDLDPKFDKGTLEYKVQVDQSVEKINISAKAYDDKASVSGDGERSLSLGENTIDVKVTAENGNEKVYKIIVMVEDLNPIGVNVDKKKYTIVKKNNDLIDVLDNFEEKVINIRDQEVVSYYNPNTKVSLVILKDEDNNLGYYIYDKKKDNYSEYRYIMVGGINLQLLDNDKGLDNFDKYSITVDEKKVDIYKVKNSSKMGLVYGVNNATGDVGYYVYDKVLNTLSRYYDEEINIYKDENEKLKNIIVGLIGVFSLSVIIFVIVSLIKKKKKRYKF